MIINKLGHSGYYECHYRNGKLYYKGKYINGKRIGYWLFCNINGTTHTKRFIIL